MKLTDTTGEFHAIDLEIRELAVSRRHRRDGRCCCGRNLLGASGGTHSADRAPEHRGVAVSGSYNRTFADGICGLLFTAIKPDGTINYNMIHNMAALGAVEAPDRRLCTGR